MPTVRKSWHVETWSDLGCGHSKHFQARSPPVLVPSCKHLATFRVRALLVMLRYVPCPMTSCVYAGGGHIQHVHMMHGGQIWQSVEAAGCRETSWPCARLQRHYKMPNDGETLRRCWASFWHHRSTWSNWEGATLRGISLFGLVTLFFWHDISHKVNNTRCSLLGPFRRCCCSTSNFMFR